MSIFGMALFGTTLCGSRSHVTMLSAQTLGINGLITIANYCREWSDPRLIVVILNNRDLNMVTWELRALGGSPKIEETQNVPDYGADQELPRGDFQRRPRGGKDRVTVIQAGSRLVVITETSGYLDGWCDIFSKPVLPSDARPSLLVFVPELSPIFAESWPLVSCAITISLFDSGV